MILAIRTFARTKVMRNEMGVDGCGVLQSARNWCMLQKSIFNGYTKN